MKKLFMILLTLTLTAGMAVCGAKEQETEVDASADNQDLIETKPAEPEQGNQNRVAAECEKYF